MESAESAVCCGKKEKTTTTKKKQETETQETMPTLKKKRSRYRTEQGGTPISFLDFNKLEFIQRKTTRVNED